MLSTFCLSSLSVDFMLRLHCELSVSMLNIIQQSKYDGLCSASQLEVHFRVLDNCWYPLENHQPLSDATYYHQAGSPNVSWAGVCRSQSTNVLALCITVA